MKKSYSRLLTFWIATIALLWLAHAIALFMHEYAHSFTAWALHAKANPLALDYGTVHPLNLLLQSDIDENVDYAPLFSTGRDHAAGTIALAGVLLGNGLSYLLSLGLLATAQGKLARMFAFLFCLMSVGNFLSYVPVRTFATHADMFTVTKGYHVSPWVIAFGFGLLFALAQVHFFARVLPATHTRLFAANYLSKCLLVVLSTFLFFGFFAASGFGNYGSAAHHISQVCLYALFPLTTVLCWPPSRPFYAATRF